MATLIQIRRDTLANWTSANPILKSGEISFVSDENKFKVGDGTTIWLSLPYLKADAFIDSVELGTDTTGDYVKEIYGTDDQIIVSGSGNESASVTLSLPQNISTTSTPTFLGATIDTLQVGVSSSGTIDTTSGDIILSSETGEISLDGNTTVFGDLQVEGTFVISGSTELNNKNIILGAVETPTDTSADGGGIILKGATDKSLVWQDLTDSWSSSENINLTSGKTIKINNTEVLSSTQYVGNSATSTKLNTARAISLGGDLSGSASFDGSASIVINAVISPNSVELGTDTTGNYVSEISSTNSNIVVANSGTENASPTLTLASTISSNTTGNAATSTKLATPRAIALTGDVTGTVNFDGSASVNISTTIAENSVVLGTDTTGNYVGTISGTASQISASGSGVEDSDVVLSLPSSVIFPGTVTLNSDPTQALHAVTKQYVDAISEGLNIHGPAAVATLANIADFSSPPSTIDGVTLTDGMRVLVKDQSTASQNGIYSYVSATTELVRSEDYNTVAEVDSGDFIFVSGGDTHISTGWVQANNITTLGVDPISWIQFSGAGTYLAGVGLNLIGTTFNNTGVTSLSGTTNEVEVSASSGNVTVSLPSTINANTTGNSATSTKLATARAIAFNGDVTGTANFDGSASISITATVVDDSHNHIISNVDGLQNALDAKLNSSAYTASDILSKLITVDGVGSGLDSDLLDGQSGSHYLDWSNTTNKPDPTITLAGDATGSVTLTDVSSGTLTLEVVDNSHNHTIANVTSLQTALDDKAPTISPTFTGTVSASAVLITAADTATAASHYFVETGSDGIIRPKTLANAKAEIVTTAAVNSAAATTVGTVISGVWQGSSISTTYTDAKVASVNGSTGVITGLAVDNTVVHLAGTETITGIKTFNATTNFKTDIIFSDGINNEGRVIASSGVMYLQAGSSSSDTSAQLNIARFATGTTNISSFNIYSNSNNFYGNVNVVSPTAEGSKGVREITMSTSEPTGGEDGDVWYVYA